MDASDVHVVSGSDWLACLKLHNRSTAVQVRDSAVLRTALYAG